MFSGALIMLLSLVSSGASSTDLSLDSRCSDPAKRFDARALGAEANGVTNDRAAIQLAIDRAAAASSSGGGGGCAVLTAGVYKTGGLLMKPHATLYLSHGATLRASTNGSDWVPQMNTEVSSFVRGHLVGGSGAHGARVVGHGVLDGQCQQFLTGLGHTFDRGCPPGGCSPTQFTFKSLSVPGHGSRRLGVVAFADSVDVAVEGVTITDSHAWTAAFFNITGLLIREINVYGDWRMPNNDGLDICSSTDVLIDHVNVDTGDDCITPKTNVPDGSGGYLPLRNLTVRNSRLRSRSFGIKWGTETHGDMSDIVFDNLQIHNSHHGIGIDWRGAGHLSNAVFSNINLLRMSWSVKTLNIKMRPCTMIALGCATAPIIRMGAAQAISISNKGGRLLNANESVGSVSRIRFENITAVSENSAVFVSSCTQTGNSSFDSHGHCTAGLPGSIRDIEFVNVHAVIEQLPSNNASNGPHTAHDDTTGMRPAGPPIDAFFVEYATNVNFRGCSAAFSGQPSVSQNCYNYNSKDGGHRRPDPSGCPNAFGTCLRFGPGVVGNNTQTLDSCVLPELLEPVFVPLKLDDGRAFPLYSPVPITGVAFTTSEKSLQGLYLHAVSQEAANVKPFLTSPEFEVLEEGSVYCGAWIETQPMGGAMWATRDVRVALNNQLVFTRSQRSDGRYPHRTDGCAASWHHPAPPVCTAAALPHLQPAFVPAGGIQGLFIASPSVDIVWYMRLQAGNQADTYLEELKASLIAADDYLWNTRNDSSCFALHNASMKVDNCPPTPSAGTVNKHGLLFSVGIGDSGEDGSVKFCKDEKNKSWTNCDNGPYLTMDMAGYSVDLRRSIARISAMQGNETAEKQWNSAAASVAAAAKAALWRPELSAMFDRYADDTWVHTLQHNNLRMMWMGMFDQEMADAFVKENLMNTSRFWTTMPMPSISVSDPHCCADTKTCGSNNWSGAPEGLTLQRAVRALESYSHHTESVLAGLALTSALLNTPGCRTNSSLCSFPQQIDAFTAMPQSGDGYGPMILSLLEYTARRVGIQPVPEGLGAKLLWSAAHEADVTTNFTQRLGSNIFVLDSVRKGGVVTATASMGAALENGILAFKLAEVFKISCQHVGGTNTPKTLVGTRVITSVSSPAKVVALVGIVDTPMAVTLSMAFGQVSLTIKPNEEYSISASRGKVTATLAKSTPFISPHA